MPEPDTSDPINEEEIFQVAAALPAAERAAYLDATCAGRAVARASIEQLLAAHDDDAFMQRQADRMTSPDMEAEFARLKPEEAGDHIGPYKLLQQIGEGGFGVVWMAEQERPVRRRVALKIIKLGMDTKEVIARFEQERQALAMMDHPNIAKVFDAGATQFGRPFFVMELVRGIKITEYCDQNNLPTEGRLQLFIEVCNAVQHAHQKGVIHRDLKPSNILVTLHDGTPVPKVIDFGVAKATQQQRLTDLTVFTQFEQMIGTPLYMSPEQAEMSGLDIDTRSDIYSLGVLLYELLTGRTPFDPEELMRKGLDEMRLAIREQEPSKPSTVLHTMAAEKRTAVAHRRQADSAKLVGQIQGDLDWIVMKALEKDRTRRYETANGLARDVERHLASEPITARPTSRLYRFRRLVRRNKLVFAAGALVAAALLIGSVVSTLQASRARRAESIARSERDRANEARRQTEAMNRFFTDDLLGQAQPDQNARERKVTLEEVLEKAAQKLDRDPDIARHPETEATLQLAVGETFYKLGVLDKAERHLQRAVALRREKLGLRNSDTLAAQEALAWFLSGGVRRFADAEPLSRETWQIRREVLGPENPDTLNSLDTYAGILQSLRKMAEAEKMWLECVRMRERVLGAGHRDTLISLGNLACFFAEEGRWAESEQRGRESLARRQQKAAGNDMESFAASSNLALARFAQGDAREAEQILNDARTLASGICGPGHPYTMHLQHVLARVLASQGEARREEAESLARTTLAVRRQIMPGQEGTGRTLLLLASVLVQKGALDVAEPLLKESLAIFRSGYAEKTELAAQAENWLGTIALRRGQLAEAGPLLPASGEILLAAPPITAGERRELISHVVEFYEAQGQADTAATWRRRLEAAKGGR